MRFMVIVKATPESEKEGALPDPQLMADMNKFTDELMKAGVLLALRRPPPLFQRRSRPLLRQEPHRHRRSLRRNQGTHRRLLDLAGQVPRRGHRVGQARPQLPTHGESEVEIRQVFEPEDFAYAFSEEEIQQEKRNPRSTGRSGSKEIAPLALTHPKLV